MKVQFLSFAGVLLWMGGAMVVVVTPPSFFCQAWVAPSPRVGHRNGPQATFPWSVLSLSTSGGSDNDMMNTMKQQAMDQMKNLTPQQIDQMLLEMETMNPIQKSALKAMGMDLEAMKSSMKMMKGT